MRKIVRDKEKIFTSKEADKININRYKEILKNN